MRVLESITKPRSVTGFFANENVPGVTSVAGKKGKKNGTHILKITQESILKTELESNIFGGAWSFLWSFPAVRAFYPK